MISERISGSMLTLTCGQEQGAPAPAQMPAATHDSPIAPHDLQTNQKSQSPMLLRQTGYLSRRKT